MAEEEWPIGVPCRRYRVRFKCPETESEYMVASHFGPEKAIAMATKRHLNRFSREDDIRRQITRVTVTDVGPVARDERGVAQPESSDLVDQWEW